MPKRIKPDTTRLLYRNSMDMIFFAHVSCFLRHVDNNLYKAFEDFRITYDLEFDQYQPARCYYLYGEMSNEYRDLCRKQLKELDNQK